MIDLILKSEVNQYMAFKSIAGSFIIDREGNLENVPDSRSAIFKDHKLSFTEKNQLMRFFKLIQGHLEAATSADGRDGYESKSISEQDLESLFVEFLSKIGISPKLKSIVLYAIAMADYDQENGDANKSVLKEKDGIDRLVFITHPLAGCVAALDIEHYLQELDDNEALLQSIVSIVFMLLQML